MTSGARLRQPRGRLATPETSGARLRRPRGRLATPSALSGLVVAQLYLLLAPELLRLTDPDVAALVGASIGGAVVVLVVVCVLPITDVPVLAVLAALGTGVVLAGLNVAGVGAGATALEAACYALAGALLATRVATPALALALPVVVALADVVSLTAGGPGEALADLATKQGDPLSLAFPDWGGGSHAGRLGISDAVFVGVFLLLARRLHLRPRATAWALCAGIVAAVGLGVALDEGIPVLPFLAVGFLAVNADRLLAVVRAPGAAIRS